MLYCLYQCQLIFWDCKRFPLENTVDTPWGCKGRQKSSGLADILGTICLDSITHYVRLLTSCRGALSFKRSIAIIHYSFILEIANEHWPHVRKQRSHGKDVFHWDLYSSGRGKQHTNITVYLENQSVEWEVLTGTKCGLCHCTSA